MWLKLSGLQGVSRSHRDQDEASGFTLIEILVAFAIASIGMAVVYQSFSTNLDAYRRAEEHLHALLTAHSALAALGDERLILPEMTKRGAASGFKWTAHTERYLSDIDFPERTDLPSPIRVKIMVAAESRDGSPSITLDTVRLAKIR